MLVVGCTSDEIPTYHEENRDTVAAGIQNLLLAANAAGLASFWSSPPLIDSARALDLCGFAPDDRIVGVIYLGWPTRDVAAPERPHIAVNHISG